MREKACFMIGPSRISKEEIKTKVFKLNKKIDQLISLGVRKFICLGKPGFDYIAASMIVVKQEWNENIQLIYSLPYPNHHLDWSEENKNLYLKLLSEANEVSYYAKNPIEYSRKNHNRQLALSSTHCISALTTLHNLKNSPYSLLEEASKHMVQIIRI